MTAIAQQLDHKLHQWSPETAKQVEGLVSEIIRLADTDSLDIGRSRAAEQEVLDLLDEPPAR
ncbi:MAG: hypothetical protein ACYDH9_12285 [Limisphaerales bacterium]